PHEAAAVGEDIERAGGDLVVGHLVLDDLWLFLDDLLAVVRRSLRGALGRPLGGVLRSPLRGVLGGPLGRVLRGVLLALLRDRDRAGGLLACGRAFRRRVARGRTAIAAALAQDRPDQVVL